jgi:GTP diphosphokinase / guanosine-3',5'-bis(diphosphate) 3'-diphosphatase
VKEWIAVLRAADCAARWHVHQRRKGAAQEPYINHLLEVAMLVAQATEGGDLNLVIAAVLHDAIEDQEVPRKLITSSFGKDVAKKRKQLQIETAPTKSRRAKVLKLADKTSNLRAIAASPPPEGSANRRLEQLSILLHRF